MGRQAFIRFLAAPDRAAGEPGVHWGGQFASWDTLRARGVDRSRLVRERQAYVVDPSAGLESIASLFAVATVADTVLIWASAATLGVEHRQVAPGLVEIDSPTAEPARRPLWGVCTSGSSGTPKVAVGHADSWELIALHYDRAVFQGLRDDGAPMALATCLPLEFSAAFFMTVLPSMFLRRDLVVFPPHDWTPVQRLARERNVFVLGVPALAAAACLGTPGPVDMSRVALFLGGGHVSAERVRLIRERFRGASIANIYGTAETGAIAVDYEPGHNRHVGFPIPGKAVWLEGRSDTGIGAVAAAGPDCCQFVWRPGSTLEPNAGYVASTDYGRFDDEGHLCLEGRIDGGEKLAGVIIYPRAIERHLLSLDGVADVRVLVKRTTTGLENLVARVVGRVDESAVANHCSVLPEIERPTRIECISEREAVGAYSTNGKL